MTEISPVQAEVGSAIAIFLMKKLGVSEPSTMNEALNLIGHLSPDDQKELHQLVLTIHHRMRKAESNG